MKLQNNLEEMAYPSNFDLQYFSNLRTFRERIAYCEERLQRLGSGSSRIAYKVDDEKVLKIAKNRKGLAQNSVEADWNKNNYECFAKIFEADTNNYTWIEMELTRKMNTSDYKRLIGYTPNEVDDFLYHSTFSFSLNNALHDYYIDDNIVEKISLDVLDNYKEPLYSLQMYVQDYQLENVRDLSTKQNWGIAIRDGVETPVVIDSGLNDEVYNQYYNRYHYQ